MPVEGPEAAGGAPIGRAEVPIDEGQLPRMTSVQGPI